jgi:leucyl aminopeptidase
MPMITASPSRPEDIEADVLPVLTAPADAAVDPAAIVPGNTVLTAAAVAIGATGARDQLHRVPAPEGVKASSVLLVGLGADDLGAADAVALRRAFGGATRSLAGVDHAVLALPGADADALAAAVEGAALGAYAFTAYKSAKAKPALARLTVAAPDVEKERVESAIARADVLSGAVNITRDLVNTPPNLLFPQAFAERAQAYAADLPVTVTVLDEDDLRAGGYGGIVGVGQGSARPPRLVRLEYAPAEAREHVALVGKGITFDTGGISIKPAAGMEDMTMDMGGAATVLAATLGAARLGLPVRVTCFLAIAENMPGGGAQRPGDVVTMRNGTTVEVLNTDAEGRMVMADALVDAAAEDPDLVLDVATLTGAAMVALGTRTAAVMGTEDARTEVLTGALAAGEPFWPLPFPEELRAGLDGRVADLRNMGASRHGGALTAGIFLSEFVDGKPWAHLDIAGTAFADAHQGYMGVGATGMSVRTVLAVLEARAAGGASV